MFTPQQLQVMENLGPALPQIIPKTPAELVPKDHIRCACNKKNIHVSEIRHYSTGVVPASDSLCRECLTHVPDFAVIVCLVCRAVVARLQPHQDRSGFKFEPRTFYHTDSCPTCKPGVATSKLIEKELFNRKRKG